MTMKAPHAKITENSSLLGTFNYDYIYQKIRKGTNMQVKCSKNYQRQYLESIFKCVCVVCFYFFDMAIC